MRTRRWFLMSVPAVCLAEVSGKGHTFPSAVTHYPDGATEFNISRLTDPAHSSFLRAISKRSNFLLYSSDVTGRLEAFRMDLKSGHARQLTEAEDLDPASLSLMPDDHGFCYLDGNRFMHANMSTLRAREVYQIPDGFERGHGSSVAEDGQYAMLVEKRNSQHRLQLVHLADGTSVKLVDADEELRDPIPRPRRASILYRRGNAAWLANYDGQQNYRLRLAEGETGPVQWSPDGRAVLYLNYPEDTHKLHNLREFTPDTNEDKMIAKTSQFVSFGCNSDASVFVGASGSKASPHVLLLVRTVGRELTLAEHRASNPQMVAPMFSPNSQKVFWTSDLHGKPAIYSLAVEKLVEETDANLIE